MEQDEYFTFMPPGSVSSVEYVGTPESVYTDRSCSLLYYDAKVNYLLDPEQIPEPHIHMQSDYGEFCRPNELNQTTFE